jgi:hypothetical protein
VVGWLIGLGGWLVLVVLGGSFLLVFCWWLAVVGCLVAWLFLVVGCLLACLLAWFLLVVGWLVGWLVGCWVWGVVSVA